ncbi:MAG: SspI [Parcubacteria group bacterium GW2011_GWA2_44_12]|nr:MAG: SspI [Parcubacteria group bacterium GW2011_GWA2_44_12]
MSNYEDFKNRFKLLASKNHQWTHTKNAVDYFDSLTNGWIDYSHNHTLVKLFSLALNSSEHGHKVANEILQKDIDRLKKL